jgi:NAD(P)-dependent dehydrogenase (short-subunit alcohol dehydrogenase family)
LDPSLATCHDRLVSVQNGNHRAVIVTGSARGIGLETAHTLKAGGFAVIGLDVLPAEDAGAFETFVQGDLREQAEVRKVVQDAVATFGALHGLVNNAVVSPVAPFLEASLDDLDKAYQVNIRALFLAAQEAARAMVEGEQGGSIVNIASVNAERGVTGTAVYSLTKGAVATLTRTLAVELAPYRIRCNAVAPSPTGTRRVLEGLSEEQIDVRVKRIPWGRLGEPSEIAKGIAFLLSDEASFVTGITLPVDGGYLAYGS